MLIIYAHPNKDGHCGYALKSITELLKSESQDYSLLDLYKINYNPVMSAEEHYTSGHHFISEDARKLQPMLSQNDKLIIIYPTWWNSCPAILKGYFDRTLTSGFAYRYEGKIPKGLLRGKAAVITSTGGPKIFEKYLAGNRSLQTVVKDTLGFCGLNAKGFMIDSARKLTDEQKRKIEKIAKKCFEYLVYETLIPRNKKFDQSRIFLFEAIILL